MQGFIPSSVDSLMKVRGISPKGGGAFKCELLLEEWAQGHAPSVIFPVRHCDTSMSSDISNIHSNLDEKLHGYNHLLASMTAAILLSSHCISLDLIVCNTRHVDKGGRGNRVRE